MVILFRQNKRLRDNGEWGPTYYATESCGIAAGMFIAAVHRMGLVTLTHTPSPMGFLKPCWNGPTTRRQCWCFPSATRRRTPGA
ncbi:MAG: hypothetical protein CM15mP79_2870 [Methanobacteriota archaeon]|nr:MAG: hypothetical protein CM15mP79_2870 [Euryarchaeota archaeon]